MAFYLGIDGGGTKTACAVGGDFSVLARATSGPSNLLRAGEVATRASLHDAIGQACSAANVSAAQIKAACIGAAGASRADVADRLRGIIAEVVPGHVSVVGDMVIALESAFPAAPGVVVIAGTGSIAYGRNQRGDTARAGGWGPYISDEGSGDWIGRQAVSASLRACDAGQVTSLIAAIMQKWKLASREDIARAAYSHPQKPFAELVACVLSAAEEDDAVARDILTRAGIELAQLAKIVLRRLWPGEEAGRICISGSVFQNSLLIQQVFLNSILAERRHADLSFRVIDPVAGALTLARNAAASGKPGSKTQRSALGSQK